MIRWSLVETPGRDDLVTVISDRGRSVIRVENDMGGLSYHYVTGPTLSEDDMEALEDELYWYECSKYVPYYQPKFRSEEAL